MASTEIIVASFLAIMLIASLISHKLKLPYTLVLVIVGIFLTTFSISLVSAGPLQSEIQSIVLGIRGIYDQMVSGPSGGLFVGLIVPPLIFEAMMHVSSKDLKDVFRPAFFLATVGVVIATLTGGLVLWKLVGLPYYVSFLFAALISPTDAATVVAIFKRAKVPSKLSTLMDTEAALNDATAIVIFTVILTTTKVVGVSFIGSAESFAITFGGGILVGLGVAFFAELVGSLIQDRLSETLLTIFAVYGSYAFAASFGFSGLVAVAIVGIYFGNLTIKRSVGPSTREAVQVFWEVAAFLGNSVAFLFIGFRTDFFKLVSSVGLILVAYTAVALARMASVYPTLAIFNRIGDKIPMSWRNVAMLGGMRGAISVALVASIPVSATVSSGNIDTITTMVLGVAFLSISIQAAALSSYIKRSFPSSQTEELNTRLSKAVANIESLEKLRDEGKLTTEVFASELERQKDELREVLNEIHSNLGTKDILKSRASEIYNSVLTLPMSRAMHVLKIHNLEKPIEGLVDKTKEEGDESAEAAT